MTQNNEFGNKILEYRAKERISQGEMARRCGVTVQTLCNVENGIQTPSKLTRTKIEMVMNENKEVQEG